MLLKKIQKNISQIGQKIPDYPYRILVIGGSGSGKLNYLFNLTSQ